MEMSLRVRGSTARAKAVGNISAKIARPARKRRGSKWADAPEKRGRWLAARAETSMVMQWLLECAGERSAGELREAPGRRVGLSGRTKR